jgi:hypothetical protein
MPVDAFLRYRQADLIPQKSKIFRLRGFFSRIFCIDATLFFLRDSFLPARVGIGRERTKLAEVPSGDGEEHRKSSKDFGA